MNHFAIIRILDKKDNWEEANIPGRIFISPALPTREDVEAWLALELKRYKNQKGIKIAKAIFPAKDEKEQMHNYKLLFEIACQ